MYLKRKSFAFNSDRPGAGGEEARAVFEKSMQTVDMTFQNLDSSEISLTDVSHYFDSDPTNLVQGLRKDGKKPNSYVADTTTANAQVLFCYIVLQQVRQAMTLSDRPWHWIMIDMSFIFCVLFLSLYVVQVRTLAETVRLDSRTKLLNPKWYEGMMSSGYEGVREIQKRLNNTMGWSATSGQVDNWVYDEANATFMEDPEMAQRLMDANPNSFRKMVANFLEASGRGYWDANEDQLNRLKELYMEVEDKIEGVE